LEYIEVYLPLGIIFKLFCKEIDLQMKGFLSVAILTILLLGSCTSTQVQNTLGVLSNGSGITAAEAGNRLKEALSKGLVTGIGILSKENGFYGNDLVRIPWPDEAKFVMDAMLKIGMKKQVDNVNLALNRAAERASAEALDVFLQTVRQMTIQDAMGILLGGDGAATNYLRRTTTPILTEKFRPIVESSLMATNATKLWSDAIDAYNKIPLVNKKVETDLTSFVTQKALEGVYLTVQDEENKIRNNISERTSPLLQKVFGYADSQKK
jgi:DNA-binding Lrp family transcriptional regulator